MSYLLESLADKTRISATNKTATPASKKKNAVLTLLRCANYNSCRTKNSSHIEFRAVGCGGLIFVQEPPMTHFEEATG
jgi:hypothetical protein